MIPIKDIPALVKAELNRDRPTTQEGLCDVAARVVVIANGIPKSDSEILMRAYAMAEGLFGPAWIKADEAQKSTWVDMCETALRRASNLSV